MNLLGMKRKLLPYGNPMGGKGGGGQTTSTGTTYQTNIPEYAQPYVETMLGATQKQLFTMDGNEITGFRPYKPYSTNLDDYSAPFSPLQRQALQQTGQLGVPQQFGDATTLAGVAGLGSLGAGQQYAQNVTDPSMMQAYMSPFQQNVTDIAKASAVREAQMAQNASNLGAARQGTYGGARQTLAQSERERNLLTNLSNIQAQGSQSAYDKAMQAQQFGSTLGMQGLGQAGQAASTLGQLGGQQLGAQKEIIGTQFQMGAQQQAMEQQKVNQAIQDALNAQQYPLMQLGVMSNMLRGLPMQATTTQQYVAAPNAITQGIGTIGALGSLGRAFGQGQGGREGGLPSEFKPATGIKSYSVGSSVKGKLYDMSSAELEDYIKETSSPIAKQLAEQVLRDKVGKASGGIIAFQNRGEVEDKDRGIAFPKGSETDKRILENVKNTGDEFAEFLRTAPSVVTSTIADKFKELNQPRATSFAGTQAELDDLVQRGRMPKPPAINPASIVAAAPADTAPAPAPAPASVPSADIKTIPAPVPAPTPAPAPAPALTTPAGTKAAPVLTASPGINTVPKSTDGSELDKFLAKEMQDINKPQPTREQIIAERKAYIGPDEYSPKEKARLMAERTNVKAEGDRQFNLRMANFFAEMATLPGSTAYAGLTALKKEIPNLISDRQKLTQAVKEIDKGIVELSKVDRLEKAGEYDKAEEIKQKNAASLKARLAPVLTAAAKLQSGKDTNVTAERVANIKSKSDTDTNKRLYSQGLRSSQTLLETMDKNLKASEDYREHQADKKFISKPENKTKEPIKYKERQDKVTNFENDYAAKTKPLRDEIDFYRRELKMSGDNINATAPKGKVEMQNGVLTYVPNKG